MEEIININKQQLLLKNESGEANWYNVFDEHEYYNHMSIKTYIQKGLWKIISVNTSVAGAGTQYSKDWKKLIVVLFEVNKNE
jgi:hypothetical protein